MCVPVTLPGILCLARISTQCAAMVNNSDNNSNSSRIMSNTSMHFLHVRCWAKHFAYINSVKVHNDGVRWAILLLPFILFFYRLGN